MMDGIAGRIAERIRHGGPVSVAAFMTEAMFDPREGYYATKNPIGAGEDFITAPSVSQMFGELMGLWCAQVWMDMGQPGSFQLVELGPGTGQMMSDIVRAGRAVSGFMQAAQIHLIEASAALKMVQGRTLTPMGVEIGWLNRIEDIPPGPAIIVGNEFLDCLPMRQAVKQNGQWHERMIALNEAGDGFRFAVGPQLGTEADLVPERLRGAPDGTLAELRPGDQQVVDVLAQRFSDHPGHALFVDYGPALSEAGDTFQAIRQHQKCDPLEAPGTADLTARVDFEQLGRFAKAAGLDVAGPATQGDWLNALGLEVRAAALIRQAPEQKSRIARQVMRLSDPDEMGALFKVMSLSTPGLPKPPGFADHG
ncbi:SAM-dependent methyltransferase [Hyphobacterium sp. CCMP332]|uniref:class I SAM-dependent methyltransferase n=1 Tax=Hyphobacterium sp. CCMP332 TaxID=2749086 RepID=UPI00164FFE39|nr:SAM-dependent methyltransferase [Hyphobacterium sp. CCMP332]QNL18165.1 SAM-dependent methyltransferase [Hyphobacterium sp. CCMP332]